MTEQQLQEIPPVLRDPPWRRTPESHGPKADFVPSAEPPRLVWREGERDRYRGAGARVLAGNAAEQLFERLVDQLEKKRPLPIAEVQRLPDELLGELAQEVVPDALDIGSLRLLLGRLGEPFVVRAVALVRASLPERGLFAALAPVHAAELAGIAATQLAARRVSAETLATPFTPSDAEAWLERFPDAAAEGLLAAAIEPGHAHAPPSHGGLAHGGSTHAHGSAHADAGHRAARMSLAWIAARGEIDAMRPTFERAGEAAQALLEWLEPFAALAPLRDREGLAWLPAVAAHGLDHDVFALIMPHAHVEAVPWVARALTGPARAEAITWLGRHRAVAEPVLANAVSSPGSAAEHARIAQAVLAGDATAGDPALDDVPSGIPPLPSWFAAAGLPAVKVRSGQPLPPAAVAALGEMLRFSPLQRPYAGLIQVRDACDPTSLDDFALALLGAWTTAGEEPRDRWALDAAGKIGGDGCAREIARRVRSWAQGAQAPQRAWDEEERQVVMLAEGDRGWAYALTGVWVLAAIGSDLALTLLDDIARGASQTWLKRESSRTLETVLEGRQLRREQLDDEMVPDLGLETDGSMTFDLGGRHCRVSFDETLAPRLMDAEGKPLRAFPRQRKDDDAEKVASAKRRFQALSRDTKVLARQQIAQLEAAMCRRRAWSLEAFQDRFVAHPLLRHLGRRLLWGLEDGSATFRIAEDGTFADAGDAAWTPSPAARIVIVHPALLPPETLARWSQVWSDYQIMQPFPQLGREVFEVEADEQGQTRIARIQGATTNRGRLFGLKRRGWSSRAENGLIIEWVRELPAGATAHLGINPPMAFGEGGDEAHTISSAWCTAILDRLPRIDYSELARDLEYLKAG